MFDIYGYYSISTLSTCKVRDALVTLNKGQGYRTEKRVYRTFVGLSWQQTWWGLLDSFCNRPNRIFPIFMIKTMRAVWLTLNEAQDQLMTSWCITMSEAVTVASLMIDHDLNSFRGIACGEHIDRQADRQTYRQTDRQTDRLGVVYVNICKRNDHPSGTLRPAGIAPWAPRVRLTLPTYRPPCSLVPSQ